MTLAALRETPSPRIAAAYKEYFGSLAPENVTHMVTISLGRVGTIQAFNRQWCPRTQELVRLAMNIIDKTKYRRNYDRIPHSERFAFLARGETRSKDHKFTYLHLHILIDAGSGGELSRFNRLRGHIRQRLRRRFRAKFGLEINSNLRSMANTAADVKRLKCYFTKDVWFDVERIFKRDNY